ncbi:MAG: M14 family zinc carboxypeptidase, partial [Acidobacteriota bacterium]
MFRRIAWILTTCLLASIGSFAEVAQKPVAPAAAAATATRLTSPKEEFGHNFGDDYFLANYQQISAYWKKLAKQSSRIVIEDIGKTAEGRTQLMAIVTSPENQRKLARYKQISQQLANADGLTDAQARALAKEGKTVVWIDGGLHATEVLGAQQLGEMVYQFVSRTDEETMRMLNDCIILFVHANPDGNDLTADWYMRNPVPEQRTMNGLPKLYQKYIGHDNNRDFFGSTQAETENMNRVLYREWFPQIVYNHHQSGPAGTVLWSPPLRDPFNYNQDPLLVLGIQTVGLALHTRLAAEGKPGATMRSGGPYDGWWNGGLRNTAAFHNMIAILTEMIGNPTPQRVPLVMDRQLPSSDLTYPVTPTLTGDLWHFRTSIEYSIATNRGVLDIASKMRENFLYDIYKMGRNSIERGSNDTWTPRPHRLAAVAASGAAGAAPAGGRGGGVSQEREVEMWAAMHKLEDRDPRAFVIPSTQRDFLTANKFINALLETGIRVERATQPITVGGKTYPAGSFVVNANQAFRPHIIDMFEPQDHPDNFPYPGAPPTRPYDNAGWTLAFQMGIEFDRLFDTVKSPALEVVKEWNITPTPGVVRPAGVGGYLLSHAVLDSFRALNALSGKAIAMTSSPMVIDQQTWPAGSFWVEPSAEAALTDLAKKIGISARALTVKPDGLVALRTPRIGLWDIYGGSMEAGWTRWILEQFDFKFDRVFAPQLDAGNLNAKYDVFIFADDWGWGDLSAHGHPWLKTPHLDRLAREGTDFHQFNVLN